MINTKIKIGEHSLELEINYIRFVTSDNDSYGFYNRTNRKIIKHDKFHCDMYNNDYFVIGNESIKLCVTNKTTHIYISEHESDFLIDYINYCIS